MSIDVHSPSNNPHQTAPARLFPVVGTVVWLTVASVVLWAVIEVVLSAVAQTGVGSRAAVATVVGVVWAATVLSLIPVAALWRRGVVPVVTGYFVGAGLRFAVSLVAAVLAVKLFAMPLEAVMVTLAVVYPTLLFIEVAMVGRHLWRLDSGRGTEALA